MRSDKPKKFIPKPVYPGGPRAMSKFISENLSYPEEARLHHIEGMVVLRIEIDFQGNVIQSKILKHLGYGCDEEAKRITNLLKFDVPKIHRYKLSFLKKINVRFKFESRVNDSTLNIHYEIKSESQESKKSPDRSYHYTIKI